jgi:hypothetical protein
MIKVSFVGHGPPFTGVTLVIAQHPPGDDKKRNIILSSIASPPPPRSAQRTETLSNTAT